MRILVIIESHILAIPTHGWLFELLQCDTAIKSIDNPQV